MRTFTLPQGVDENQIQAEFNDGVLSIRIPKAALPQPKRIQIGGSQQKQQASVSTGNAPVSSQQSSEKSPGKESNSTPRREREQREMAAQSAERNR
jgi:hypothetical protein